MSLKAIHILFIVASTLLCFGFAAWAGWASTNDEWNRTANLWMAGISAVAGVCLLVYGRYFLRKLKDVSYL